MSGMNQGRGTGIVVAAVAGAAVGAGVALLLAPCSGADAREWLTHRTRELKDKTTSALAQGKDALRRTAKDIGRDVGEAATALDRPMLGKPGTPPMRG